MSNDSQTTGTILVVDDEEHFRFIVGANLRTSGFEIIEAEDAPKALALAVQRQPDVIIMDVALPGMDGVTATRSLKADPRTADIPVIMLTGRSRPADVVRGLEAGAQEYLVKPFAVPELLARVRTVHRLSVARRELDRLNSRLEEEVEWKTQRLRLLYEFMRDLNHAQTRDDILDLVIRCVHQTTMAKRISLFLINAAGEKLVCERALGIDPGQVEPQCVTELNGITGQVFRSGKTLAARTICEQGTADGREYQRDAFVSTPLFSTSLETPDGVIGVLNVTDKDEEEPFSEDEIECIRSIAGTAAIALANITRRTRLQQSVQVLLRTVGHLAEYRDEETTQHLERVSKMARILAEELRRDESYSTFITDDYIQSLVLAAPLHDIGKVGIPDEILTKPGKLTDEEYQIMKTHTDIGRRVLLQAVDPRNPVPLLQMCIDIAHGHHERFDGKGYPRRLAGQSIPLAARIVALVDAYDAMRSERRYKPSQPHDAIVETIRRESGKHFDPVIVEAFLRCHERFRNLRTSFAGATSKELVPAR